ncbi:hypothetical protein [Methanoculleus chikugoensis]|uniref:hypothetical protein n=1 Tax=Methanoculleus chikugoensis TaxID=118126 RepID=UPI000AA98041|nr:hypothetical protein [Methanoculleus chikugoensis]
MTERVLTAMQNDHVDIIGHPTGRILLSREPYRIDLAAVFDAAATLGGVLMEINAFPGRLDLSDVNARAALGVGVRFSVASDAIAVRTSGVWNSASRPPGGGGSRPGGISRTPGRFRS